MSNIKIRYQFLSQKSFLNRRWSFELGQKTEPSVSSTSKIEIWHLFQLIGAGFCSEKNKKERETNIRSYIYDNGRCLEFQNK